MIAGSPIALTSEPAILAPKKHLAKARQKMVKKVVFKKDEKLKGNTYGKSVSRLGLCMSCAWRLPVLRARDAFSVLEHHFFVAKTQRLWPAWLRAPDTLMGPGALAMRNLLKGKLKALLMLCATSNFLEKHFGNLENSSVKRRLH